MRGDCNFLIPSEFRDDVLAPGIPMSKCTMCYDRLVMKASSVEENQARSKNEDG